jgi:hypothetical protein
MCVHMMCTHAYNVHGACMTDRLSGCKGTPLDFKAFAKKVPLRSDLPEQLLAREQVAKNVHMQRNVHMHSVYTC